MGYTLYQKRSVWYVYFAIKGRKGQKVQKSTRTKDRAKAEKIAESWYIASVIDTSIDAIADRWIYYHQFDRAERTKIDIKSHCLQFSNWLFKTYDHRDALKVDKLILFAYRMHQEKKLKYAPTTISIHFRTIKSVFNWARSEELITNRPFEFFKIPKARRKELIITRTEIRKILSLMEQENYLYYLYIRFVCLTGCRRGEFEHLKLIDIGTQFIYLVGKSGRRPFRASRELLDVVSEIRKCVPDNKSGYLFTNANGKWLGRNAGVISKIFKKYIRLCGLNDSYTLHTIRHSMISYQLASGVNAYTVKGMAGHSSVTQTEWYSHLATEKNPPLQWW